MEIEESAHRRQADSRDSPSFYRSDDLFMEWTGEWIAMDSVPDREFCDAALCRFPVGSQSLLEGICSYDEQVVWFYDREERDHL